MRGEYKDKQVIIRMKADTLKRTFRAFPPKKDESMANYFSRLSEQLNSKEVKQWMKINKSN